MEPRRVPDCDSESSAVDAIEGYPDKLDQSCRLLRLLSGDVILGGSFSAS